MNAPLGGKDYDEGMMLGFEFSLAIAYAVCIILDAG
jgi:hypothetical protein